MKFDEIKLKEKCSEWSEICTLDLNNAVDIKKDDQIQITTVHHPHGGLISTSVSSCWIVGKYDQ